MDAKRNGKTVRPADAADFFFRQQEDAATQARARMLQRMGLGRENRDSDKARQRMIDRQTRRE